MVHEGIYSHVQEVAHPGWTIAYGDPARLANLDMRRPNDRKTIGKILSEIKQHQYREGRPLLSAIVVLKRKWFPSNGFYMSAAQLGLLPVFTDQEFHRKEPAKRFWRRELSKVYEYWTQV